MFYWYHSCDFVASQLNLIQLKNKQFVSATKLGCFTGRQSAEFHEQHLDEQRDSRHGTEDALFGRRRITRFRRLDERPISAATIDAFVATAEDAGATDPVGRARRISEPSGNFLFAFIIA